MSYIVDFVLNVVKGLSDSEPVLFQRDGALYVASPQGFGQITYGLHTEPLQMGDLARALGKQQPPEILESTEIPVRTLWDGRKRTLTLPKKEKPFLEAVVFGPDSTSFTLEDMAQTAQKLTSLPDDGKIRLVQHSPRYRSHKYGYGADGTDVWVDAARVMNRDRYLELLRKKEAEIDVPLFAYAKGAIENVPQCFPDCVILTPYMMVSLPRPAYLPHEDRLSWDAKTSFNPSGSHGFIFNLRPVNPRREPFAIHVTLNTQQLSVRTAEELTSQLRVMNERISRELHALEVELPQSFKIEQPRLTRGSKGALPRVRRLLTTGVR